LTQTLTGFVAGENASVANVSGSGIATTSATNLSGVGNYIIVSNVGNLSASNYNFTAANGTLTINKAHLLVTANDQSRVYGSNNPTFTQTISGFVNGENASVVSGSALGSSAANATTSVGNYTITAGLGNLTAANYDFATANGVLTINKAQLLAVGNKVYDGSNAISGSQLNITGVNGETFVSGGSATMQTKNVQTNQTLSSLAGLTLTGVNGSSLGNYEDLSINRTSVSVTPLNITLVAPNATKTYDGTTIQQPTASDLTSLSAQLVGGDRVSSAAITYGNASAGGNKTVTLNSVVVSDDNGGRNYNISVSDAHGGIINKANLTVTAVSDGKIVTQNDAVSVNGSIGYGGVVYSGFVGGETAANLTSTANGSVQALWTGTVARTNISGVNNEAAGNYTGVLTPSGWSATNYNITYQSGNYVIVPADTLLVKVVGSGTASVTYGSSVSNYNLSAQYVHNGTTVSTMGVAVNGYASIVDGVGGAAIFNLNAINGTYSSSGNLNVGGYNLNASNVTVIGSNFNNLAVVGAITVTPKLLINNLGTIQSVSKVYDGSTSITAGNLSFNQTAAGLVAGDLVSLVGSGSYADRNVGANKSVTLSMGLISLGNGTLVNGSVVNGTLDALNYVLSNSSLTANIGSISQLPSVTYTGANNGNWSTATNWAGGALPDGNNVAQVIIPVSKTVVYDSSQVGVIGSTITNNGSIVFNSANPFNLTNTISGNGSITQRGPGMLTISGNNTLSGAVDIGSYNLTVASSNALGGATLVSNGGSLTIGSNVTLPSLRTSGNLTLTSGANISNAFIANNGSITAQGNLNVAGNLTANGDIAIAGLTNVGGNLIFNGSSSIGGFVSTYGNQFYGGPVTFTSSGVLSNGGIAAVPNFFSSAGNISFNSTVSAGLGSAAARRNLVVSAQNGAVLFNDQVGQNVIDARNVSILTIPYSSYSHADISPYALEVAAQKIQIFGDISTFNSQQYTGAVLIGNNGANGKIRLLLSMDPSINVSGSINDAVSGQDVLVLRAIRLPGDTAIPTITYGDVGTTAPLAGFDVLVGQQNTDPMVRPLVADISPSRYDYVGTINNGGSVSTTGNQLYVGNNISLTGVNTLTSQLGTIEMITGLTNGNIRGLSNANFVLGANASLGNNLVTLGANITRLAVENNALLMAKSSILESIHGIYVDRAQQLTRSIIEYASDASMAASQVMVSDVNESVCAPLEDDLCKKD
jgi:hypothetical protein